MRIVKFIEDSPPYAVGEEAGFDDGVAAKIVGRGAARYVGEADGAAPAATPVIVPDVSVSEEPGGTPVVSTVQPGADETIVGDGSVSAEADYDAMSDDALRDLIERRDGRRPGGRASRETLLAKAKGSAPNDNDGD